MDITIISQRYAKALYLLALEMNKLEAVYKDIELLDEVTEQNPELRRLLKSPVILARKKNRVITGVFKGKIEDLTLRFLQLVTRKEREIYMQDISNAFTKFYKEYHNILSIKLTSAQPLDKNSRDRLVKKLSEATHKTIDLEEETDASLLGGYVLKMDDRKYDASIKHQLENLKKEFDKNLYVKGF